MQFLASLQTILIGQVTNDNALLLSNINDAVEAKAEGAAFALVCEPVDFSETQQEQEKQDKQVL